MSTQNKTKETPKAESLEKIPPNENQADSVDGSDGPGGFRVNDLSVKTEKGDGAIDFEGGDLRGGVGAGLSDSVSTAMLETAFLTLSKIAISLTGYQEIGLDDDEVSQLVRVWTPFAPDMSPVAMAIISTSMIVSSKTFLYLQLRRLAKARAPEKLEAEIQVEGE